MTAAPLTTIVITTHNRPDYLDRAVRSALAQTVQEVEVVVVDNGSTPPSAPASTDPRLRLIRRRDGAGGPSAARNAGLAAARGQWITFLDDDDELAPEMIERSLVAAESSPLPGPVAVMSVVQLTDVAGNELERFVPPTLERGEHYFLEARGNTRRAANSLVVPTELLRAIGGFDERLGVFQHGDLGLRLNRAASIQSIDAPLYKMTMHEETRLSDHSPGIIRDMERTLEKHPGAFDQHRSRHARYMATLGIYSLRAGDAQSARRWCVRALRRDPRQPRLWLYAVAAAAGPIALRTKPWATLQRRRLRKYGRKLLNYPRALLGSMLAPVTRAWLARTHGGRRPSPERVLLLSVYRARNAAIVDTLVAEARSRGWEVRLWALDAVDPALRSETLGVGAGAKFPLLNRLLREGDAAAFEWVVVADDDVALRGATLADLLAVSERAGLDLAQPAHTELSHRDNAITVRRPLSVARLTSYVENGPLFAVRRPFTSAILPFPGGHEMGWGLELEWFDLCCRGARLGIVDGIPIRHLRPVGADYAKEAERDRLRQLLRDRGLRSFSELRRTFGSWRPWQSEPPWLNGPG
jgi:glycosyltransferase involved in cell wall biosynthesis